MQLCIIRYITIVLAVAAISVTAQADNISVTDHEADFDRWNYPFNGSPGTRAAAPTFGAINNPGFDDRDGQFLIGFDTEALGVPTGLAPSNYLVDSLSVTATHRTGSFVYDPTYDGYTTYLENTDPAFTPDTDAGRPIVLTGAGLRNGFTGFTFGAGEATTYAEDTPFQFGNAFGNTGPEFRHAFAAGFDVNGDLIDVSNNVRNGFDINPWAVGQTGLNPGDAVTEAVPGDSPGSTFTFTVDLSDPDVLGYVQEGLANGGLFFSISSLTETTQENPGNPNFFTTDDFGPAAIAPEASFGVTVVPEPASVALLGAGAILITLRRRRGQA